MNKLLFFIFLVTPISLIAQNSRKILFGKIFDDLGILENAHIVNLNTRNATYTNTQGEFKILAKIKDSLKITSVGYKTQILILETSHFGISEQQIQLKKEVIELDEVKLKKHNLTGNLVADLKQIPKNKSFIKSKNILDFSTINFSEKVISYLDEIERSKNVDMSKITDPTKRLKGITIFSASLFTSKKNNEIKQQINQEKERDELLNKIISIIGKSVFIEEFKIPEDEIYNFLEYCNQKELNQLSNGKKIFELIEFLNKQSKSYVQIIKRK